MKLYKLDVAPDESAGEGEDWDEWFPSLDAAKDRRQELIDANPTMDGHRYGKDYAVSRVTFTELPPLKLLLAVLNRVGCHKRVEVVVLAYAPDEKSKKRAAAHEEIGCCDGVL